MKVEIGKDYKTYGGWFARVIWLVKGDLSKGFYAIHKPAIYGCESPPIYHGENGKAHSIFSVNEPLIYEAHHPADIVEGEVIKESE